MALYNWITTNIKHEKISEDCYYKETGIYVSSKIVTSDMYVGKSSIDWTGTVHHRKLSDIRALKYEYLFPEDRGLYKWSISQYTRGRFESEKNFQKRRAIYLAGLTNLGLSINNCDFLTSDDSLQKIQDFQADIIALYTGDFNKNINHVMRAIKAIREYGYKGKIIVEVFRKKNIDLAERLYKEGADVVYALFDRDQSYAIFKIIEDK